MTVKRALGPILFALAIAAPARAQRTPAAAPEAKSRYECADADTLRAREDVLRDQMHQAYDVAVAAHDVMRDRQDSAATAKYRQAMADYARTRRAYDETVNQLMRIEMRCMRDAMDSLRKEMPPQPTGWLGVSFSGEIQTSTVDGKHIMRFTKYPTVESVEPSSPAEKAGVEPRDVMISFDGADLVKGAPTFAELLVPGRQVQIKLKRGKSTVTRTVVVERRPMSWAPMAPMAPMTPMPPEGMEAPEAPEAPEGLGGYRAPLPPRIRVTPGSSTGEGVSVSVWYDDLTIAGAHVQQFAALKEYFGVDSGVLVLTVIPGTPAAAAGLHDGDVITRADGKTVASPMQLSQLIGRTRSRGSVTLDIVRQRKKQTVTLKW